MDILLNYQETGSAVTIAKRRGLITTMRSRGDTPRRRTMNTLEKSCLKTGRTRDGH